MHNFRTLSGRLHADPDLALDFWALFSRLEYALKAAGLMTRERHPAANWGLFCRRLQPFWNSARKAGLMEHASYLLNCPPRKQINDNGVLRWVHSPPQDGPLRRMLVSICRLRENLFHGTRLAGASPGDYPLNTALLRSAVAVLQECLALSENAVPEVFKAFYD